MSRIWQRELGHVGVNDVPATHISTRANPCLLGGTDAQQSCVYAICLEHDHGANELANRCESDVDMGKPRAGGSCWKYRGLT